MSDEWGPWFDHDGKGCPCVGALVWVLLGPDGEYDPAFDNGPWDDGWTPISNEEGIGIAVDDDAWSGGGDGSYPIIAYRIRKPRGLTILESLLENLPDEVPA